MAEEPVKKVEEPTEDSSAEQPQPPDELEWWEKQIGLPLLDPLYTDSTTGR